VHREAVRRPGPRHDGGEDPEAAARVPRSAAPAARRAVAFLRFARRNRLLSRGYLILILRLGYYKLRFRGA
jgi:hypothetical protein